MHTSKFTKFKFIVRDARVFPGVWFDFIFIPIIQVYSLLLLRYMLQPIRIRFTALSCFKTSHYQPLTRSYTHANKTVIDRQTKLFCKQTFYYCSLSSPYIRDYIDLENLWVPLEKSWLRPPKPESASDTTSTSITLNYSDSGPLRPEKMK